MATLAEFLNPPPPEGNRDLDGLQYGLIAGSRGYCVVCGFATIWWDCPTVDEQRPVHPRCFPRMDEIEELTQGARAKGAYARRQRQ